MKVLKRFFRKGRSEKVSSSWNDFIFPGAVENPHAVGVFASPGVSGIWSAVYMARALQESYTDTPLHFVVHRDFMETAGFLPWKPEIHVYDNDSGSVDPVIPEGILLFTTEPGDDLLRFVEKSTPSACVSMVDHPAVNIRVKIEEGPFPGSIGKMMSVIGLKAPEHWVPEAPALLSEKASAILSPVSHRTLPYILATEAAASILEKKRAEIPLKLVITDGKTSNIPPDTDNPLMAAIVAGASAVITNDRDLWVHASALRVPVIGLDRKGVFTDWDREAAAGDTQFLEQWAALIRRGW